MPIDSRRLSPLFGVLIAACVLGAVLIDRPGFAIAGWALALILAAAWIATSIRARRTAHQADRE